MAIRNTVFNDILTVKKFFLLWEKEKNKIVFLEIIVLKKITNLTFLLSSVCEVSFFYFNVRGRVFKVWIVLRVNLTKTKK